MPDAPRSKHFSQLGGSHFSSSGPSAAKLLSATQGREATHAHPAAEIHPPTPSASASSRKASRFRTRAGNTAPLSARAQQISQKTLQAHNKSMRNNKKFNGPVIFGALLGLVIIGAVLFSLKSCLPNFQPKKPLLPAGTPVSITIPDGAGASQVAQMLLDKGVILSREDFLKELETERAAQKIKPGNYDLSAQEALPSVVALLIKGPNSAKGTLRVPEGKTLKQTEALIAKTLQVTPDKVAPALKIDAYRARFSFLKDPKITSLEGFLFPKTYSFSDKKLDAKEIVSQLLAQYEIETKNLDFASAAAHIYQRYGIKMTQYDFLKLASVIEREAVNDDDRSKIASVFYNRLKNNMPLQSDATMNYVTGKEVKAHDLKTQSPYNTYLNKGLPPTPICSPSIKSLKAALNPPDTNLLYFFIIEDGKYSDHSFSSNYQDHLKAIERAQAAQEKLPASAQSKSGA